MMEDINEQMAGLDIDAEENEELCFDGEVEEDANKFELCLVGRFLTKKNINTRAMRSKLADVWRSAMGINIKELKTGIFLFQFYHKDNMCWVQNGGPWSFDNAMLVLNKIEKGENPLKVPLVEVHFWLQIYDLPPGYMFEAVGKQLGNFFGSFLEYDPKNNASLWREYMRIKVKIDIRKPLKRKKKITRRNGNDFIVHCKYERLGDLCFKCGMITHTERFCQKKFTANASSLTNEWGAWLRAPPRREGNLGQSKWLRSEDEVDWGERYGKDNNNQHYSGKQVQQIITTGNQERNKSEGKSDPTCFKEKLTLNTGNQRKEGKNSNIHFLSGPGDEEYDGLELEERKRKRYGPINTGGKGNAEDRLPPTDSTLSEMDCAESTNTVLATLALQASRPL